MMDDAVLVALISESLNGGRPARRTAAEMLLQALRSQQMQHVPDFTVPTPQEPEVKAEIENLTHALGISRAHFRYRSSRVG